MANGDLHLLGTFYKAGVKQLVPTNPWRSGRPPGGGNIPVFSAGQSLEIRDTDPDSAYQLRWREVNIGSKKLLIADRNILEQVSWNDLNAQNLIFGKEITIDGQQYKLRVLTGGEEKRGGGTGSSYDGGKLPNEWDDIIVNEGNYSGLPTPNSTDLGIGPNDSQRDGAHNQFWNWYYVYSWCQETYKHDGLSCAVRGYSSARLWNWGGATYRDNNVGWRPVLEVLNSAPSVTLTSPTDNQVLTEGNSYQIAGNVTDADDGDVVTVKYKINNESPRNITASVTDGSTPIPFNKTLTYVNNRLYDGATPVTPILSDQDTHTLTVWAEDDKGGKSIDEIRHFTVLYNQPPEISGDDDDLGNILVPPSIQYSVTDVEGYPFTVTEKVNDIVIRTFPGVDSQQEILTIPNDIWITLQPDVEHQLTITATDQYNASSTRTYTFVRTVDGIELQLNTPLPADEKPNRMVLTLNGQYSPDDLQVLVCNNGFDASPTWEDATQSVLNNRPYVFTNEVKTADDWGILVKIILEPGA